MAPPSYADLGKQTRDLFSKNYRKNGLFVKIKPGHRREWTPKNSCSCGHVCPGAVVVDSVNAEDRKPSDSDVQSRLTPDKRC